MRAPGVEIVSRDTFVCARSCRDVAKSHGRKRSRVVVICSPSRRQRIASPERLAQTETMPGVSSQPNRYSSSICDWVRVVCSISLSFFTRLRISVPAYIKKTHMASYIECKRPYRDLTERPDRSSLRITNRKHPGSCV